MKLAINGLGRIGRNVLRAHYERSLSTKIQISAVNELADLPTLAHLIKYDSTHGRFKGKVSTSKDKLLINEDEIAVSQIDDISELNCRISIWYSECTGAFATRGDAEKHLQRGAKRVLFSQPASTDVDITLVYGINHQALKKEHTIISAASCTTYSSVPVIKVLG